MYRTHREAYERTCDCYCPVHHALVRSDYNDPGCYCLATCASQPFTLLAPQTGGALFLTRQDELWFVPGLEPGHWDWRYAEPVGLGHPLWDAADLITDLLRTTRAGLLPLIHRT